MLWLGVRRVAVQAHEVHSTGVLLLLWLLLHGLNNLPGLLLLSWGLGHLHASEEVHVVVCLVLLLLGVLAAAAEEVVIVVVAAVHVEEVHWLIFFLFDLELLDLYSFALDHQMPQFFDLLLQLFLFLLFHEEFLLELFAHGFLVQQIIVHFIISELS